MNYQKKNQFNQQIKKLRKIRENFSAGKEKALSITEALGKAEVELKLQEDVLADFGIIEDTNKLEPMRLSADMVIDSLSEHSEQIVTQIERSNVASSLATAGTAITTASGIYASAATLSYPPDAYPQSYIKMQDFMKQNNEKDTIKERLMKIDVSLGQEYGNAWGNLFTQINDPVRTPMFLIREVFRRLLDNFAPDEKVVEFFGLKNKGEVKRQHKLDYMTNQIQDEVKKKTFTAERNALDEMYGSLSKAHKPGSLDFEQSQNYLYQANGLIKLILDTFT